MVIYLIVKGVKRFIRYRKNISNQETLMERERLASLGQLIGGIAHNLKSPIMSISGATEGLTDLIKEYEESIVDKDVTVEDHLAIASDMKDWISKIKSYLEYMSDIITAVKGQAVTLSETENVSFDIDELVKKINNYLINIFNSETYEKVLYSYILFRTELLTAIKGLRTVLKLNKPDETLKLPSEK